MTLVEIIRSLDTLEKVKTRKMTIAYTELKLMLTDRVRIQQKEK